jgi:hypothetical protein
VEKEEEGGGVVAFTLVFVSAKCTPPLRLLLAITSFAFERGEVCPTRISHPVGKGIRTGDEAMLPSFFEG